jgi:hypothetical protein
MEIIDIGLGDLDAAPIKMNLRDDQDNFEPRSVNFGGGIEMFMNDEQRSNGRQVNVDFSDLDKLESQLNSLSGNSSSGGSGSGGLFGETTKSISGMASNLFGFGSDSNSKSSASVVDMNAGYETDSKLGQSTTSSLGNTRTWDGFTKVGDIPPDNGSSRHSTTNNMSDREKRRKKREMIKKLEEWYEAGQLKQRPSSFTMDSPYDEIEDEFEGALEDKRKKDSVKLQGWWFITLVNSLEYANSAFDPFGISLDGWGEKVSEDLPEYEEIFSELHDKYKGGKLAPEVSLLMRLGFSAAVVGFSNKALSSAAPAFGDVIRQSPELMRTFNDATVKALSQQSPGFAFASNLMKPSQDDVSTSFGPPPKPIETKSQPPPVRPGAMQFTQEPGRNYSATANPNNRPDIALGRGSMPDIALGRGAMPDIALGRGAMFRENGVDLGNGYSEVNRQNPPMSQKRPEMRGPQNDVDDILSGLKMKTINIHEQPQQQQYQQPQSREVRVEDESMVSISSLRDMSNMGVPKKSNRRKNGSEKNTISLGDI